MWRRRARYPAFFGCYMQFMVSSDTIKQPWLFCPFLRHAHGIIFLRAGALFSVPSGGSPSGRAPAAHAAARPPPPLLRCYQKTVRTFFAFGLLRCSVFFRKQFAQAADLLVLFALLLRLFAASAAFMRRLLRVMRVTSYAMYNKTGMPITTTMPTGVCKNIAKSPKPATLPVHSPITFSTGIAPSGILIVGASPFVVTETTAPSTGFTVTMRCVTYAPFVRKVTMSPSCRACFSLRPECAQK